MRWLLSTCHMTHVYVCHNVCDDAFMCVPRADMWEHVPQTLYIYIYTIAMHLRKHSLHTTWDVILNISKENPVFFEYRVELTCENVSQERTRPWVPSNHGTMALVLRVFWPREMALGCVCVCMCVCVCAYVWECGFKGRLPESDGDRVRGWVCNCACLCVSVPWLIHVRATISSPGDWILSCLQ